MYEEEYDIYPHISQHDPTRPLAPVEFHEAEEHIEYGILNQRMKMFIRDKVYQKTGLNFDDYLDKPKYVLDMLHKEIQDDLKRNKNVVDELNNQFNALG